MMTPFQCDVCHFRNIYHRVPDARVLVEAETLEFIRQLSWIHSGAVSLLWFKETYKKRNEG
jgi:hypothetical protein